MSEIKVLKLKAKKLKAEFKEQITVSELINLLKKCPKDYLVFHEGCDCCGKANGIEIDDDDKSILITRS